jgi:hypothetical protein
MLSGSSCHLQSQNASSLDPCPAVKQRRMLAAEPFHDHSFAHAAVAIDGDTCHPGSTRMIEKAVEDLKNLTGTLDNVPSVPREWRVFWWHSVPTGVSPLRQSDGTGQW